MILTQVWLFHGSDDKISSEYLGLSTNVKAFERPMLLAEIASRYLDADVKCVKHGSSMGLVAMFETETDLILKKLKFPEYKFRVIENELDIFDDQEPDDS